MHSYLKFILSSRILVNNEALSYEKKLIKNIKKFKKKRSIRKLNSSSKHCSFTFSFSGCIAQETKHFKLAPKRFLINLIETLLNARARVKMPINKTSLSRVKDSSLPVSNITAITKRFTPPFNWIRSTYYIKSYDIFETNIFFLL